MSPASGDQEQILAAVDNALAGVVSNQVMSPASGDLEQLAQLADLLTFRVSNQVMSPASGDNLNPDKLLSTNPFPIK